jgi:hypothetical protein
LIFLNNKSIIKLQTLKKDNDQKKAGKKSVAADKIPYRQKGYKYPFVRKMFSGRRKT